MERWKLMLEQWDCGKSVAVLWGIGYDVIESRKVT